MFHFKMSWILENVMLCVVMSSPSLLSLCVFFSPAEYLALCPNGGGITGDGRGRAQKLIICGSILGEICLLLNQLLAMSSQILTSVPSTLTSARMACVRIC